jgi:hypothetical protein
LSDPPYHYTQVFMLKGGYSIPQKEQQAIAATGGWVLPFIVL